MNHHHRKDRMSDVPTQRPFNGFLADQRGGALHAELTERLAEVTAAVIEHGKAGSLTLTIKISQQKGAERAVIVADDLKVKVPAPERGESLFFADEDGNLSRRDPRQPALPLSEARKAGEATS